MSESAANPSPESSPQNAPPPAPLPSENRATAVEEVTARADTVWVHPGASPPLPSTERQKLTNGHGRVAIVAGARTPFVKAGSQFQGMDVVDLSGVATSGLMARTGIDPREIDMSVFGVVVPALHAPNLGREVVFRASLPDTTVGTTVNLACASSNRAITFGAEAILKGEAEVVLAGGAESLSNVPIRFSDEAAHIFMQLARARSLGDKAKLLAKLRPGDLAPVAPAIAEYTTGQTMGQSAEKMAKENDVSRLSQDEVALMSHQRAAAAHAEGRFDEQIVPTFPPPKRSEVVDHDTGVRADSTLDALTGLKPVFDKRYGTLTAGNSSPLTDGASAVLLMSEEKAKALGYTPLGYIRSFAFTGVKPGHQLLQGPAYAAPVALERAGVDFSDIDLVEMHEAFAAQILSNLKALASKKFAEQELGRSKAVAEIDFDKINVNGGSIAIGHPFGATGARVTMQLLHELKRRGLNLGLMTVCAAGGTGFAMVVERE
ncbi:MAG TPA: acetyl-CoA C-acyltransferase FadI [Thermoanaerobaculia bacterium]|nr:acetyl-CoA C-acyltransferase FadI [Thermoanaerobaculia bacterium]